MLPFALSRVLGLDSVHIGVRDVPVLQSTKRSQAAPAVPPRPATISQSPGLQRESLRGPAAGLSSSTVHFDGGSPFLGIVHYQRNYDRAPAPYFDAEAMRWIVGSGITSLVVDLPSLDRSDDAELTTHRIFWGLAPGATSAAQATRPTAMVTELAFIDDSIADGPYLLNLQVAPFVADAAPSRPILLPLTPT